MGIQSQTPIRHNMKVARPLRLDDEGLPERRDDFPGFAEIQPVRPARPYLPDWARLMDERQAAAYLSIGVTTLRGHGPRPVRLNRRRLYDRGDLDRWADRLGGQPLTDQQKLAETEEVERRFFEKRDASR